MDTNRQSNESLLDYKIRLCQNREDAGLSWAEVATLVGDTRNPDSIRKWWTNFSEGFQHAITANATTDAEIQDLEEKRRLLQMERNKKQVVTTQYNRLVREEARRELLFEHILSAIQRVQPPTFNDLAVNVGKRDAILGLADIHFGKAFESVNNRYNERIMLERMERLLAETLLIVHKENLDHLHVLNAGDSVEGIALRISQLTALQYGLVDSTIKFARMIVEWLTKLSQDVSLTYHHITSANHSEIRPLGTSAGQFPNEDMERIIHAYVHDMLENNQRIVVPDYGKPYVKFSVCDYVVFGAHGHAFKSGVENALKGLTMQHREFIDYLILGHFHHGKEVTMNVGTSNNVEILQLPSVMGGDEYSDSLMTGAQPGAKLYVFEEGKGKTIGYDIRL